MNLTIDPWIPALRAQGRRELFSLQGLFAEAHEIRDLAVKPHERVALMRLLLCITQAALDGPANEGEWASCERLIQPRVRDYLATWKGAFELFGGGQRFLQFSSLKPGRESDGGNTITKLDLALASGNNSTLFDNLAGGERALETSWVACSLVTFQCFSPGGRIGVAKLNGKETRGNGSSNHAPCTPCSMVHTVIVGDHLLATIHRNLLAKDTVLDFYGASSWGKPVWELSCEHNQDTAAQSNATMTYLGRLVPLSRAIRLHEGGRALILANGLDYPVFPAFREPTATVVKRKDSLALLPASTSRSLWRQLSAISVLGRAGSHAAGGPLALNHVSGSADTTVWVGALITDKAKIEDVIESTYSLPSGMFTELGRAAYERGVSHAEEWEAVLIQAVKTYGVSLKLGAPADDRARRQFWTRIEQNLASLFALARDTDLAADFPKTDWGRAVGAAALAAYEHSCPRHTPRQIEAYALGLRRLAHRPKSNSETDSKAHE